MNEDKDRVNFAVAVKGLRENMPALMEYEAIQAKITWRKFCALQAEGFTPQQALELCKKG